MPPKVSVIVPNYNHAPYLKQRLDSIFNQTFQDFEVIILDDCSTDNSKEIIEQYRNNPKVSHIVYNETNSGSPFKQWAKGFNSAKGDYIWIAESDDWADINFLKDLLDLIGTNQNISVAFTNSNKVYQHNTETNKTDLQTGIVQGDYFIKTQMLFDNTICNASAVIFKKELLKAINNDYQEFKGSGDYLFWIYLCEQGNVAFLNKALNYFRQHKKNTTSSSISNGTLFLENHKIFQYLKRKGYVSKTAQAYVPLFWRSYIKDVKREGNFNCNPNELQKLWKKENKGFFKSYTFLFVCLFIIKSTPLAHIFFKKNIELKYYQDYSLLGIVWKIFNLPNTNFRK